MLSKVFEKRGNALNEITNSDMINISMYKGETVMGKTKKENGENIGFFEFNKMRIQERLKKSCPCSSSSE